MSLLIRGGTVVKADQSQRADVLCDGGLIRAVGAGSPGAAGAEVVDAGGRSSCRAASTRTPTCSCPSWARSRATISSPAPPPAWPAAPR